jgi:hypothetical protein
MLDAYYIVESLLRKQSFAEYYQTLDVFADALDRNELYNANRPAHIPPGSKFREHKAIMKELGIGADRGDALLKEQRQAARELAELDMDAAICYQRTIAINRKDPTILQTLQLPLKENQPKSSRRGSPQHTEIHLEVKHLKGEPGAIVIVGSHVRNGGPYLINLCKGEPTSEEDWYNPGGHYNSCGKIIIRNLESANRYYVRMRTDGPEGPGQWSQPVSIVVL